MAPAGPAPPARRQPPRGSRAGSLADPGRRDRRRDRVVGPPSATRRTPPATWRSCATGPPPRGAGGDLPRPPQRFEATSPLSRGAARARRPDPGRAGAGRARDRLDRGRLAPGQGPHRAALGHLPGPARGRAAPGRSRRPGRGQRVLAGFLPRLNGASRSRRRSAPAWRALPAGPARPRARLQVPPQGRRDHTIRLARRVLQLPRGATGASNYAGKLVEVHGGSTARSSRSTARVAC